MNVQLIINPVLRRLMVLWKNPAAMQVGDPYQNLVAIVLSARTRDEQVLKALPDFFKAFPDVRSLAKATARQVESKICSIGMYRQKAWNLKKMAVRVVEDYDGEIPKTIDLLVGLPGVGRKTANVLLSISFNKPAIAVDTHVHRVTDRLGWVKTKTPEKIEKELLALVPKKLHKEINRVMVKHGRYICVRNPRCWACPVRRLCGYADKNLLAPKNKQEILDGIDCREKKLEKLRRAV